MTLPLKSIGFYTLSDDRCRMASGHSPLWRAELLLTSDCNLRCRYCRGVRRDCEGGLPVADALAVLDRWIDHGLRNVRFSGGEPTICPALSDLVHMARLRGVRRIAISTNGTASQALYERLLLLGVDDVSISLDSCCAETNDKLAGVPGTFHTVCRTLRYLAKHCYVTVGCVVTPDNTSEVAKTVQLAHDLGVADIRLIPTPAVTTLPLADIRDDLLATHPVLAYRVGNLRAGIPIRGLTDADSRRCRLVLDDVHVAGSWHFPCVIYFREGGHPIGTWRHASWRNDRVAWADNHDCHDDPICSSQCLDVCRHYNNRKRELEAKEQAA